MAVVEPGLYPEDQPSHEAGPYDQSCEEYGSHFGLPVRRVPRDGSNLHNRCKRVNTESVRSERKV